MKLLKYDYIEQFWDFRLILFHSCYVLFLFLMFGIALFSKVSWMLNCFSIVKIIYFVFFMRSYHNFIFLA